MITSCSKTLLCIALLGLVACKGGALAPDADGALVDATTDGRGADAPVVPELDASPDAPPPAPVMPSGVAATAGGGVATSAGHRIQLRVGAPQPIGNTASAGHQLTTGPGAIPWMTP